MPLVAATRAKQDPNLLSRSRMRYFGPCPEASRFPQLLCRPGVGWRASDPHMDDLTSVEINDEEGEQRAKEEVGDLQEITGPSILGMVMQERGPGLSSPSWGANTPHVLLNGPLADAD